MPPLGFSYWFVSHKLAIKRIATALFFAFDIVLGAYLIYLLIVNIGIRQAEHDALIASFLGDGGLAKTAAGAAALAPASLQTGAIATIVSGAAADIVVPVANPNAKWGARFTYHFMVSGKATAPRAGFVLPGETRLLYDLNVEGGAAVQSVEITDVAWVRDIDYQTTYEQRLRGIEFTGVEYIVPEELSIGEQLPISRVRFTVANKTAYSYRDARFTVVLLSGSATVGVNSVALDELRTGQSAAMEATWFGRLPRVTSVQIVPEINVLDQGAYLR